MEPNSVTVFIGNYLLELFFYCNVIYTVVSYWTRAVSNSLYMLILYSYFPRVSTICDAIQYLIETLNWSERCFINVLLIYYCKQLSVRTKVPITMKLRSIPKLPLGISCVSGLTYCLNTESLFRTEVPKLFLGNTERDEDATSLDITWLKLSPNSRINCLQLSWLYVICLSNTLGHN